MSGFADLRLNQASGQADDSFWPSFTDIMAVVVMIFLITTSVLILRNWELIKQITQTVEAEERAKELARETSKEKATVEEQLAEAEHRLSMLRLELLRAEQERQKSRQRIAAQNEQIAQLRAEQTRLQRELAQEQRGRETLAEKLELLSGQFAALQSEYESNRGALEQSRAQLSDQRTRGAQLEQQASGLGRELEALREDYREQEQELTEARETSTLVEARYESLIGEYDALRVKYDKLIKPARTARGKYVVEVRYLKREGQHQLSVREPEDPSFSAVDLAELHQILNGLRERYPDSLYIKIIFPESSGLSYAEAWDFTQDLLSKYDYYHRAR